MYPGISSWVARWAELRPDAPAITFGDEVVTWSEFDRRINRFAHLLLDLGVAPGDRVGLYMTNRPVFLEVVFACARVGAVIVPCNLFLTPTEVRWTLNDAGARIAVTHSEFDAAVAGAAEGCSVERWLRVDRPDDIDGRQDSPVSIDLDGDHPFAIVYTSGTTGFPKGAVLTHGNVLFSSLNCLIPLGFGPDDRFLNYLPLSFGGGLIGITMGIIHAGAQMVLQPSFDPGAALAAVEEHGITLFGGVPTMCRMMLDHPRFTDTDLSSARACIVGGAPPPVELIEAYQARGITFIHGYGLTEGAAFDLALLPEDSLTRIGSCGRPLLYCDAAILDDDGIECPPEDVGELCLRGPQVFSGYWGNPEATAEALAGGWLHTGDLARRDKDGFFYIVDRKKDMVISGGLNVYPAEVEAALLRHPAVGEAAVVGLPDEQWGERVTAFLVARPGEDIDVADLRRHCESTLAAYKVPKEYRIVAGLPKTMSGKILKRLIREDPPT